MWPFHTRTARRPARRPVNFRPRVEALEDRSTPSGGALDPTFGTGGIATVPVDTYRNIPVTVVQPDGKILTAQLVLGSGSTTQPAVTRLTSNGTVDTAFGTNGTIKFPLGKESAATALTVAPDGKILVGFRAYAKLGGFFSDSSDAEYAVGRLNPNGTLDTTFGNNHGYWLYNPSAKDEVVLQLATVPVAGGGYSVIVGGTAVQADGSAAFAAAKLTQAGLPDPTFGTGGLTVRKVSTGVIPDVSGISTTMAVTTSGEVVFAGRVGTSGAPLYGQVLVGFTPAGQPDAGFGTGGVVPIWAFGTAGTFPATTGTIPGTIRGMSMSHPTAIAAPGNSLIVAGTVILNDPSGKTVAEGFVIRYSPAGTLDSTFGTGGVYYGPASLTTGYSSFSNMAVGADGSIAVAGLSGYKDTNNISHGGNIVGRLTADGHADPGFGTAGTGLVSWYDQNPYPSFAYATLNIDPNGNILVGGVTGLGSPFHGYLMRFTVA